MTAGPQEENPEIGQEASSVARAMHRAPQAAEEEEPRPDLRGRRVAVARRHRRSERAAGNGAGVLGAAVAARRPSGGGDRAAWGDAANVCDAESPGQAPVLAERRIIAPGQENSTAAPSAMDDEHVVGVVSRLFV